MVAIAPAIHATRKLSHRRRCSVFTFESPLPTDTWSHTTLILSILEVVCLNLLGLRLLLIRIVERRQQLSPLLTRLFHRTTSEPAGQPHGLSTSLERNPSLAAPFHRQSPACP